MACSALFLSQFSSAIFEKENFENGWNDLIEKRNYVLDEYQTGENEIAGAFHKAVVGKSIKLEGYLKQVGPHFAGDRDYYFTKDVEAGCLPYLKNEFYCGKSNEAYVRVIFNGTGYTERDFEILMNPNKNRYLRTDDDLKESVIADGNYKVFTYNKKFSIEAEIVDGHITCSESGNCTDGLITVHIDKWRFLKNKTKKGKNKNR